MENQNPTEQALNADLELIREVQQQGWELRVSPLGLLIDAPTQAQAKDFKTRHFDRLAESATKIGEVVGAVGVSSRIWYPGCRKPYRILPGMRSRRAMNDDIVFIARPGICLDSLRLSAPLLRVFEEWLANPEVKGSLIRRSDQRQVALTEAVAANILGGGTLEEAIKRRREDYWYLPDLEDFRREVQQRLEPNNPQSTYEYKWRGCDRNKQNWREFAHQFRLIQDSYGVLYEVAVNLGVKPIAVPDRVTV